MFEIIKNVINSGRFELNDILTKIDTIWIQGDISEEQKAELVELARQKADYTQSIDFVEKLKDHDQAISNLEKRITSLEKGEPTEPVEPVEYPEYVEGKWYYNGDKVSFKGKNFECIAPSGVVCTWSPEGYPTYWQEVIE